MPKPSARVGNESRGGSAKGDASAERAAGAGDDVAADLPRHMREDVLIRFAPVSRLSWIFFFGLLVFLVALLALDTAFGRMGGAGDASTAATGQTAGLGTFAKMLILVAGFVDFLCFAVAAVWRQKAHAVDPLPRNTFALLVRWGYRSLMVVWFLAGAAIFSGFVGLWVHQAGVIAIFGLVPTAALFMLRPRRDTVLALAAEYKTARQKLGPIASERVDLIGD